MLIQRMLTCIFKNNIIVFVATITQFCNFMTNNKKQKTKNNSGGQKIDYSEGFCCTCEAGSTGTQRNGDCSLLASSPAAAHCLDIDQNGLWYMAFSLSAPETRFNVHVTTTYQSNTTNEKAV